MNSQGAVQVGHPETQIESCMNRLRATLERAQQASADLCGRLGPIQRTELPHPTDSKTASLVQPSLCPIAEQIRNAYEKLDAVIDELNANRERIEL